MHRFNVFRPTRYQSFLTAIFVLVSLSAHSAYPSYTAMRIGTTPPPNTTPYASAYSTNYVGGINNAGQLAGFGELLDGNGFAILSQATIWEGTGFQYLNPDPGGGPWTFAYFINNLGHVVGASCSYQYVPTLSSGCVSSDSVLWIGAAAIDLGSSWSVAAINDSDEMIGYMNATTTSSQFPVYWKNGQLFPSACGATALNNKGDILSPTALCTSSGTVSSFGSTFYATSLNDFDVIGGSVSVPYSGSPTPFPPNPTSHAAIWQNGVITDLGILPGGANSWIYAINNTGTAVGQADVADKTLHAAAWIDGQVIDLNTASNASAQSLLLTKAVALNSAGQIVCQATVTSGNNPSNIAFYVLLIPADTTSPPIVTPSSGSYGSPVSISMWDVTPGASIYYTLDGTAPTAQSTKYTAPFLLSSSSSIRATVVGTNNALSAETDSAYVLLSGAFSSYGIGTSGTVISNGGVDGAGNEIAQDALGPALAWNGAVFSFGAPNVPDVVIGKTVALPEGHFDSLQLIGFATKGNKPNEAFVITYTDGSTTVDYQSVSDWATPQSYAGETIVKPMDHRITQTGAAATGKYYVYGYQLAIDPTRTVKTILSPIVTLGMALRATPPLSIDLSPYASVTAVYRDGVADTNGGLDRYGNTYSSTLLGSALEWMGSNFAFGAPDVVDAASGTTLTLPSGLYAGVRILAAGVNGAQLNQAFVVTYQDGSQATVVQNISDWHEPNAFVGESIAATESYRLNDSGDMHAGPYYLYGYTLPFDTTKPVASITLPQNRNVVVLAATLVPVGASIEVPLGPAATVYGISSSGTAEAVFGGLDGLGNTYAAELLGSSVSIGGVAYDILPPGEADAAASVQLALPAVEGSRMNFLATGVRGNQIAASVTVYYTDGTSNTVHQSFSDWHSPQHFLGEMAAKEMAYKRTDAGSTVQGPYFLYSYSVALDPTKTLKSFSLPVTRDVVVLGITVQE